MSETPQPPQSPTHPTISTVTVPQTTPVTTTTSVVVPTSQQPTLPNYTEWNTIMVVAGGMAVLVLFLGQIAGALKSITEWVENRKKKNKEQDAPLEARLTALEDQNKNFRPRDDLEREFNRLEGRLEHEKTNRMMVQENQDARIRSLETGQAEDRLARTRLESEVRQLGTSAQKMEDTIDSLRERMDERFDRLHDTILGNRTTTPTS